MKKILKNFSVLLFSILFAFSNLGTLKAASASISISSSSSTVVVGNTFTVTIKVSSSSTLGAWDFTPSYDSSKLKMTSGDASIADYGDGKIKSKSYTYKFKAVGTGSTTISVKSYGVVDYSSESNMSVSVSNKTIKIISQAEQQASYSKNNNLSNLYVDGLTLNPSFNKDTTNYTVEADANTTSIHIGAKVEDSKASISGDGNHDVGEGENKINVTVTAQNGSSKTYTITVNVVDPNPIEVTIDNNKYVVVKRESSLPTPEGFEKTTIDINNQKIPGFYNELNGYTLVGLKDSESNIDLYVYDKGNNSYSKYETVSLKEIKLIPLSFTKKLNEKYVKTELSINDVSFESYKKNDSEFYIIHARNFNTGKDNYYQYDKETDSVIRYIEEKEDTSLKEKIKNYEKIIMLLLGETVIIVFVLICILISKLRKNKRRRKKLQERIEKEKNKEKINNQDEELKDEKNIEEESSVEKEEETSNIKEEKKDEEKIIKDKKKKNNNNKKKKEVLNNEETKTTKLKKK